MELRGAAAGGREHRGSIRAAWPRLPGGRLERGREEVQEVHPVLQPRAQRVDRGRRAARGHCGRVLLYPFDAQQRDPGIPSQLGVLRASQYLNQGRCGEAGITNIYLWLTYELAKRKIYNINYNDCIFKYLEAYVLLGLNSRYGIIYLCVILLKQNTGSQSTMKEFISTASGWQTEFIVGTLPSWHVSHK